MALDTEMRNMIDLSQAAMEPQSTYESVVDKPAKQPKNPVLAPLYIGKHKLQIPVIAAPMAGVSDKPYRRICRNFGASMAVSEMVTSKLELRHSTKSRYRMDFAGETDPVSVQIVGTEPDRLAAAARFNVENGAQIIDINMGCPAKKVCKKAAGSALLQDEPLVARILHSVVNAVDVPVTVKIRTGTNPQNKNALNIARIAEDAGIQALTIHGRTRQCRFVGAVEYDTIAAVKHHVTIPVIANGDIDSPEKAAKVLKQTAADGVMIGRAAQGRPWLLQQIGNYLVNGDMGELPSTTERIRNIAQHIYEIHEFYGERLGVRLARKHIKWYLQHWDVEIGATLRQRITATEDCKEQHALFIDFLYSTECLHAA